MNVSLHMVTERHNIASRIIIKTLSKGDFGGNINFIDIGSDTRMAKQCLVLPAHVASRTLPRWLLQNVSADELRSCSRTDAIVYFQLEQRMAIKETFQLCTLPAGMYTLKSNFVMTCDQSNN